MKRFQTLWIGASIVGGVVLLSAVGIGISVLCTHSEPPTPGVTVENFKRIRIGMTQRQVEQILGGPGHTDDRVSGYGIWTGSDCKLRLRIGNGSGPWSDEPHVHFGELVTNDGIILPVPGSPAPLPNFNYRR